MFEKTLTDLIRGLRAHKRNEAEYIASCLEEIRQQVRRNDPDIKAMAVSKLAHLHMLGYDMGWASFHIIEVMSSPKLAYKKIGYAAAQQSFRQDTDVLMLCTNLIKKDLSSNNYMETAVALGGLAMIVTPDLGRDLTSELIAMLNHSRPYIRKRVILVLYKVFLKYPEALRMAFPRLKEKLDDPDPSVVSSVIGVICELARKNPRNYLPLAPQLYSLLTNSLNNWMLIKIIKLFAALAPIEPRLVKKLIPPITNLIQTTPAVSLLYECVLTLITGGMILPPSDDPEVERHELSLTNLCVTKLKAFVEDPDQNLKYLGLYALSKLLPIRPKAVADHRDVVIRCLDDGDVSIRIRALDLVSGMVTQDTLVDIVRKLLTHVLPPPPTEDQSLQRQQYFCSIGPAELAYRQEVVNRIITICSRDTYANITNFEWYIDILARLVSAPNIKAGSSIGEQMLDVVIRVPEAIEHAVHVCNTLIVDDNLIASVDTELNNIDVLYAVAWICGEYCMFLSQPTAVLRQMLVPAVKRLAASIQAIYIHNALKIYSYWINSHSAKEVSIDDVKNITNMTLEGFAIFTTSMDLEVQERACTYHAVLTLASKALSSDRSMPPVLAELSRLFYGEIKPVNPKAQKRVPIPQGLDLDQWIHPPPPEAISAQETTTLEIYACLDSASSKGYQELIEDDETIEIRRRQRYEQRKMDPFYIPPLNNASTSIAMPVNDDLLDVDSIPIVKLNLDNVSGGLLDDLNNQRARPKKLKKTSKKGTKENFPAGPAVPKKSYNVNRDADMPEGVNCDRDEEEIKHDNERNRRQDPDWRVHEIDLLAPESSNGFVDINSEISIRRDLASVKAFAAPEVRKKKKKKNREPENKEKPTKERIKNGSESFTENPLAVEVTRKLKKKRTPVIAAPAPSSATSLHPVLESSNRTSNEPLSSPSRPPDTPAIPEKRDRSLAKVIYSDSNICINADWQPTNSCDTNPSSIPIDVSFAITNTSPGLISSVEFHFKFPANIRFGNGNSSNSLKVNGFVSSRHETYLDFSLDIVVEDTGKACLGATVDSEVVYKFGNTAQQCTFNLALPPTINLIPIDQATSELFTSLLSNSSLFTYTASTQFAITSSSQFTAIATTLAKYLRLHVVETVGSGVSIIAKTHYSSSQNDGWIAGLIKLRPKPVKASNKEVIISGNRAGVVAVELKGSDRALVDAVLDEVGEFSSTLE
ncbi:hypothetical protein SeMB42_g03760 [Synchytrium endobioticum]|uniref:AP-3 complex subunit delta n=1 Tax=Synchytrium endobioticum TaxID=286115 RepID=A0A507CUU4_9FUNG|nr:hypothetical protein SeLEV6574_g05332 [Synchytrium endobioticum]TPX46299.1 hypothetical protein SeMB42_g03760 [Synchytrium endobioticum]